MAKRYKIVLFFRSGRISRTIVVSNASTLINEKKLTPKLQVTYPAMTACQGNLSANLW